MRRSHTAARVASSRGPREAQAAARPAQPRNTQPCQQTRRQGLLKFGTECLARSQSMEPRKVRHGCSNSAAAASLIQTGLRREWEKPSRTTAVVSENPRGPPSGSVDTDPRAGAGDTGSDAGAGRSHAPHGNKTCSVQLNPCNSAAAARMPYSPCSATKVTAMRSDSSITATREWPPLAAARGSSH